MATQRLIGIAHSHRLPHKHMAALIAVALSAFGIANTAAAEGDATRGQAQYAICAACHGANGEGNKDLHSPRLAGMTSVDLVRQIENFKSGARGYDPQDLGATQMKPMVATLTTPQAVEDVVAYIGTLKAPASPVTVQGDAAKGAGAYAVCAACHGQAGEGNPAMNAPKLAGQHDWYIVQQLKNFKSGIRGKGPGDVYGPQMAPMAMILVDDAAIANVAAYIATLEQ